MNLKAPFLCAQQAVPLMQSPWAVERSSTSVRSMPRIAKRSFAHYSSSKAGLEMLTKCMALELAEHNIQANSIIVGAIGTEMTPPERRPFVLPAVPAHRIGTADEIARLVTFLCSDACPT